MYRRSLTTEVIWQRMVPDTTAMFLC